MLLLVLLVLMVVLMLAAAAAAAGAAAASTDLLANHLTLGLLANSFIGISLYMYNGETAGERYNENCPCRKSMQNSDEPAI